MGGEMLYENRRQFSYSHRTSETWDVKLQLLFANGGRGLRMAPIYQPPVTVTSSTT